MTRSLIKKTVMTIPYNITVYGVREQFRDSFEVFKDNKKQLFKVMGEFTKDGNVAYLLPAEVNILGDTVYKGLLDNLPSLRILSDYLDAMLRILLKLDLPVIWITPSGLKISLSHLKYDNIRTSSSLVRNGGPVTISIPTEDLDTRKIKTSFMPNLVHSLDASNIHLLCNNLRGQPLYTIHDCFATTANNMSALENQVKSAFISIYFSEGNYLEKMHNSMIQQINSYVPIWGLPGDNEYVTINNKDYLVPKIPKAFTDPKLVKDFVNGLKRSKFFIS